MGVTPIRLILVTPSRLELREFVAQLKAALAAGDVAAVMLDLADADAEEWRQAALALGPIAQTAGAAFLLRDHVELVPHLPCDGAHITGGVEALDAALRSLKPRLVVGAGDSTTRHAAMSLGERRPDYVFLGRLDAEEDVPPSPTLVEWWTELFELPCVTLAAGDWDCVADAVAARADFVALRDLVWHHPQGAAAAVRRAQSLVSEFSEAVS